MHAAHRGGGGGDEDPIEAVLADELAVQASDDSEVEDAADIEYNRLYSFLIRPSCSSKPYINRAVG